MTKIPKRRKVNGKKHNGLHPDTQLSERQAAAYLTDHGLQRTVQRLRESRMKQPRCKGPKYLTRDGYHIFYTPRLLNEFIQQFKPRVVDPAVRMGRK